VPTWDGLKVELTRLQGLDPCPLQGYPDPRSDTDRQPPFWIQLQPWAEDVAADLYRQFGDDLDLRVGFLPYPMPESFELPAPPGKDAVVDADELVASLDEPIVVESGHTVRGSVHIENRGPQEVVVNTNGWLRATVVDPVDGRPVGASSLAEPLPLVRFPIPSRESKAVPLLVGTASFVPDLGYRVPPGEWAMTIDLELNDGRRVRTAPLPLTIA